MQLRPLLSQTAIAQRVAELGADISRQYEQRLPVLLVLMDGAFVFAADLARAISAPELRLHFVSARSYSGIISSGTVTLGSLPTLTDCDVLIIDDILDTGRTLARARNAARESGARSVATCVLLDKPERRVSEGLAQADHVGFTIPDVFVVGYGLDHDGRHRHLPCVYVLE